MYEVYHIERLQNAFEDIDKLLKKKQPLLRKTMQSNNITFYQRFEADILAGRKTITIRDKSESHFKAGDILRVGRFEDNQYFCTIEVLNVSPITLDKLTEQHAVQENMGLEELKEVIRIIYPSERLLYVVTFGLIEGKYASLQ